MCGSWKRRKGKGEKGERALGRGTCCLPLMGSASLSFIPTRKQEVPLAITQLFSHSLIWAFLTVVATIMQYGKEPGAIFLPKKRIFPSMKKIDSYYFLNSLPSEDS